MIASTQPRRRVRGISASIARRLRLAIFDVDGVMTDGRLYIGPNGEEMKVFHVLDGHGLKALAADNVEIAILSGRRSRSVELRAAELGIRHVIQGAGDKLPAFDSLLAALACAERETAYMGDDVADVAVMQRCAVAITVPNAPSVVKRAAHMVTTREGGAGAVREVCDLLIALRRRAARSRRR